MTLDKNLTFGEILEQRPLNDIPYEAFVRGKAAQQDATMPTLFDLEGLD
ncbi:hypothetical protein [Bifidobacterium olomucense]|uniref:Uncharacterized protein n=1 Tax=Bifidobacterium olomucense TaxID=2675324 RepID=A0A7Y0HXK2_9BIFI|nr:hypothetical protein [Bifidobacterium sp. DSM 109959]NMM98104.1 hypothetical protein [Bifidobacterium sp. DSM 109959]